MSGLKCLFGFHKAYTIAIFGDMDQHVLMKCYRCDKYGVWHRGLNMQYWTRNRRTLPKAWRRILERMDRYDTCKRKA